MGKSEEETAADEVVLWTLEQTRACPQMRNDVQLAVETYFRNFDGEDKSYLSLKEFVGFKEKLGPVIKNMCTVNAMAGRPAAQQNEAPAEALGMSSKGKEKENEIVTSTKKEIQATATSAKRAPADMLGMFSKRKEVKNEIAA